MGYSASVTQHLGEHVKVTAIYGSSDKLTPANQHIIGGHGGRLRKILRHGAPRPGDVAGVRSGAENGYAVGGSYQFTDYNTLNPGEVYSTQP